MARWDKESNRESIPNWFWEAIDVEPVTKTVEVDECDVSYRHYEAMGKPGMLLIHGMNAHSRWWDFIAPQLLDRYQVAAMDLTGWNEKPAISENLQDPIFEPSWCLPPKA